MVDGEMNACFACKPSFHGNNNKLKLVKSRKV